MIGSQYTAVLRNSIIAARHLTSHLEDGADSSVRIDVSEVEATEQGTLAPSLETCGKSFSAIWPAEICQEASAKRG